MLAERCDSYKIIIFLKLILWLSKPLAAVMKRRLSRWRFSQIICASFAEAS